MHRSLRTLGHRLFAFAVTAALLVALRAPAAMAAEEDPRILQLKQQIIEIQNDNDLGVTNVTLCKKIIGYSSFTPLESNVIPADGKFFVYFEPINWFTKQVEGEYEFSVVEDIRIKTKGEVIFQHEKLFSFSLKTRRPMMDFYIQNSLNLATLPAGEYQFEITLKDLIKEQQTTSEITFVVAPKEDGAAPDATGAAQDAAPATESPAAPAQ